MPHGIAKQHRDLSRCRRNSLLLADARGQPPIERIQGPVAPADRRRGQSEQRRSAAEGPACPRGQQLATRDLVARGEAEPRREVLGALPGAQVRAAFGHQLQGQRWPKAMDLSQVCA